MQQSDFLRRAVVLDFLVAIKNRLKQAESIFAKRDANVALKITALKQAMSDSLKRFYLHALWRKYAYSEFTGWLSLLMLQMLVITPVISVCLVYTDFQHYGALTASFAVLLYLMLQVFAALCVSLFSIAGAIELLRKREWSVLQQTARILWGTGPWAILLIQLVIPYLTLGKLAETQTFAQVMRSFGASLCVTLGWTIYLVQSEQIRAIFDADIPEELPDQEDELPADLAERDAGSIVGNKIPFYLLTVFALIVIGVVNYRPRTSGNAGQQQNSSKNIPPPPAAQNQTISHASAEIAAVPDLKVGDTFILESIDAAHPANNHKTKRTVTAVTADHFELSVVNLNSKSGKPRTLKFDKAWNLMSVRNANRSGYDYAPALKYFDFPLIPGKSWKQISAETDIKTGATRTHVIVGEVGQWEEVSVPAGTFHALKVTLQTELYDPKSRQTTRGTDVSWYSPVTKRSIKAETSLTGVTGNIERSALQLIQYGAIHQ